MGEMVEAIGTVKVHGDSQGEFPLNSGSFSFIENFSCVDDFLSEKFTDGTHPNSFNSDNHIQADGTWFFAFSYYGFDHSMGIYVGPEKEIAEQLNNILNKQD